MNIVFFGTSSFAAAVLAKLIENNYHISAIVTRPDRMKGRHLQPLPPPVKETAQRIRPDIPLFQPEKASTLEFAATLKQYEADLFVVVAYGEIIKQNLLDMPKKGCINIHASLLPEYRGAAPIQRCLMDGRKETGITIIEMSPQMDAGDVLAIEALPVPHDMTFGELEPKLCALSCKLLLQVIEQFERDAVVHTPQDHSKATLAPKLTPQEEEIDWRKSAEVLHNLIRALSPSPSAWATLQIGEERKRLKIKRAEVCENSGEPGSILSLGGKEGWVVACGDKALRLIEVQLEGKKAMRAEDCLRGFHSPVKFQF